jgi:hypothetical protein
VKALFSQEQLDALDRSEDIPQLLGKLLGNFSKDVLSLSRGANLLFQANVSSAQ